MRLLLDTHVAIWAASDSDKLPTLVEDMITDRANEVFVSAVTIWEIAIKYPLGKRNAPPFPSRDAMKLFAEIGFITLPITAQHAAAVESLPLLHGDPFDRLLVAQALTEPLRLITHDASVVAYSGSFIRCCRSP